jgi:hypothetical protein
MGGVCHTNVEDEKCLQNFCTKYLREREHLGKLRVHGLTILQV